MPKSQPIGKFFLMLLDFNLDKIDQDASQEMATAR